MKYYNKQTGQEITAIQAQNLRDQEKIVFDDIKFEKINGRKPNYSDIRWFEIRNK